MRAVIQRVKTASVAVNNNVISKINHGLLVLVGIEKTDDEKDVDYMVNKISNLRVFEDKNDKMNISLIQGGGEILAVSQFTLCANTQKGNRPSFNNAAMPSFAKILYEVFCEKFKSLKISTSKGVFGEKMSVYLENDGPVTIILDSNFKINNNNYE